MKDGVQSEKEIKTWWNFQSLYEKFILVLKHYNIFFFDPFNFLDFSFGPKLYFPYLLFSGLRERERERTDRERESLNSDGREKRSWLILIQTIRKVNVGVNEFHSMRRVSPKFYFSFSLPEIIGT